MSDSEPEIESDNESDNESVGKLPNKIIKTIKDTTNTMNGLNSKDDSDGDDTEDEDDEADDNNADDNNADDNNADEDEDDEADMDDDDSDKDPNELLQNENVTKSSNEKNVFLGNDSDEDYSDSEPDENYLQKFDENIKKKVIEDYYPELLPHNNEEVEALSRVVRNSAGVIIDPLHKTIPFLTKYERTRILGERTKQLNSGATPFVKVEISVIDGYLIALKELEERVIPFIIKRPLPNGNGVEYWKLTDLEII
jgi:DNA-directed RNA polymerase subunit K/omega